MSDDPTAPETADDQFQIVPQSDSQRALVVASGEIDLANSDHFHATLASAVEPARALTVDMTRVDYCDSAAIRALFTIAERCALTIRIPTSGPLPTLFTISALDQVATIEHSA
jgi:anti-anti-sigma factor